MRKTNYRIEKVEIEKQVYDGEINQCDYCLGDNQEDEYDLFQVTVGVDPNGCVGTMITRDLCQYCYDSEFAGLFTTFFVKVRAGDEDLKEHHGDRWYG